MQEPAGLITALPLFPLGTVLFPGGLLPLRIFEVRYLDMISRAHKAGTPFGVVMLTAGGEVRQREEAGEGFVTESFETTGTLAHIEWLDRPQAGLILMRCRGGQRFRLKHKSCSPHGLWQGDVELIDQDPAVPVPAELSHAATLLARMLKGWQAIAEPGAVLPVPPPYALDDCAWLANRWCELLPLDGTQAYRLMKLDNPLLRLEIVADELQRFGVELPPV
jgi:Lon protease-like protein